jgi:hypothetical protein
MATPPLKLPTLPSGMAIVDPKTGAPNIVFMQWWFQTASAIEYSINGIADALAAAGIALDAAEVALEAAEVAQGAADDAQQATDDLYSSQSLVQSGIENFTPPLLSAADTGDVTIANHDRRYGDGTIVAVTGATVATGYMSGDVAYIFYDDASRAGGAVTYQYSLDSADAVQSGDRHSVGAVTIPAAGTNDGNFVMPPGIVQP